MEITFQSPALDFWTVIFFKLTLESDCLELCYWTVVFKISWISNITKTPVTFKTRASNIIWHFILNLGFICHLLTVATQKANACSPWTHRLFLSCQHICCISVIRWKMSLIYFGEFINNKQMSNCRFWGSNVFLFLVTFFKFLVILSYWIQRRI